MVQGFELSRARFGAFRAVGLSCWGGLVRVLRAQCSVIDVGCRALSNLAQRSGMRFLT